MLIHKIYNSNRIPFVFSLRFHFKNMHPTTVCIQQNFNYKDINKKIHNNYTNLMTSSSAAHYTQLLPFLTIHKVNVISISFKSISY